MAQLGERRVRIAEVRGSNPLSSTKFAGYYAKLGQNLAKSERHTFFLFGVRFGALICFQL